MTLRTTSDSPEGKTVARIEESPTRPGSEQSDDTVLIHFTDGTALVVAGSSYEEVSQSVGLLDYAETRKWAAAAAGRREAERLSRLRREEHLAVSCQERARRREARRAEQKDWLFSEGMENWLINDILRTPSLIGGDRTIHLPCETCGERQCPNAPTEVVRSLAGRKLSYGAGGMTITIPTRKESE